MKKTSERVERWGASLDKVTKEKPSKKPISSTAKRGHKTEEIGTVIIRDKEYQVPKAVESALLEAYEEILKYMFICQLNDIDAENVIKLNADEYEEYREEYLNEEEEGGEA